MIPAVNSLSNLCSSSFSKSLQDEMRRFGAADSAGGGAALALAQQIAATEAHKHSFAVSIEGASPLLRDMAMNRTDSERFQLEQQRKEAQQKYHIGESGGEASANKGGWCGRAPCCCCSCSCCYF